MVDGTISLDCTHRGVDADSENDTMGSDSVLDVVVASLCVLNGDCDNVTVDNRFDRLKSAGVLSPTIDELIGTAALAVAPFIPNEKLFGRKFDCILLSGKVTANVC